MAKKTSHRPENRGLIIAVTLFGLAVLAGVHIVMTREKAMTDDGAELKPLLPESISRITGGSGGAQAASRRRYPGATLPETVWLEMKRDQGAIVGQPEVVRGDLLRIAGKLVRLTGIDEVRGYSHCNANSFGWRCGTTPADALRIILGNRYVACMPAGYNERREIVSTCNLPDGSDLSVLMLERGMATNATNRLDFRMKENEARKSHYGYWSTLR